MMRIRRSGAARRIILSAAFVNLLTAACALAVDIDPSLPSYKVVSGISGNLKSIGSDTLNNLMTFWSEGFRAKYPAVKIAVEGKGSSTAPPSLIEGTAQFGPVSREMKASETQAFQKKFGYKPSIVRVAVDSLAVFVHKDNPIKCLTLKQLDATFSKTRKGGAPKDAKTWGDLGLTGDWADKPISLYGRNSASGTYAYFKDVALFGGDYKDSVKEQPGSSAVVQGVASDKYAMGYSGVGYKTADVKMVPLAVEAGKCFDAEAENAYTGDYPLARFLYVYFNKKPQEPLDPLMTQFIKYVLSKEGQQIVIKDGFSPVSEALADEDMKQLGMK
jgi:phosphate transport system substrate-binding protein